MDARLARCLLLADVLAADGMILEPERRLLDAAMEREGLTRRDVGASRISEGLDEAMKVVATLDADAKSALLDELSAAALADRQLSPQEIASIARIRDGIGA